MFKNTNKREDWWRRGSGGLTSWWCSRIWVQSYWDLDDARLEIVGFKQKKSDSNDHTVEQAGLCSRMNGHRGMNTGMQAGGWTPDSGCSRGMNIGMQPRGWMPDSRGWTLDTGRKMIPALAWISCRCAVERRRVERRREWMPNGRRTQMPGGSRVPWTDGVMSRREDQRESLLWYHLRIWDNL